MQVAISPRHSYFVFSILQAVKNWRREQPGNEATLSSHARKEEICLGTEAIKSGGEDSGVPRVSSPQGPGPAFIVYQFR